MIHHRAASLLMTITLALGCNSVAAPAPSPGVSSPPEAPSPTTPLPVPTRYRLAGMVTDEGGPVANAGVLVDYADSPAPRGPSFWFPKWVQTRSDSEGRFSVEFEATGATVLLRAWHAGEQHEMDAQLVNLGPTALTATARLRRVRTIRAGESMTLSVARDSALCFDYDTLLSLTTRCEWVRLETSAETAPIVDFRPVENGVPGARLFIQKRRPGLYAVGIEVPASVEAPQRYLVSAGLAVAK